ncbi:hypothetical protein FK949_gp175 [Paramecium bursaria Chlorella virus NYs1]|uniref:Uncharacterized protein n=1 Tax=Paramecium bursaria Chlorella virus NYs1 TaxID=83442 RepID=M1IJR6_9PHYC|nr:hypothetical protein FK949_gp175 [Paramecium bursaria Chlorella virus NYs1]AGE58740.1 hypothetical protein PBCVNYs1_453L [Paramecium bursaria Chlorella virus NYs1]
MFVFGNAGNNKSSFTRVPTGNDIYEYIVFLFESFDINMHIEHGICRYETIQNRLRNMIQDSFETDHIF